MKTTAGIDTQIGSYSELRVAHLEHDEEKYNSNEDIDYSLKYLNSHEKHIDNFDEFYYENYEKPIEQVNEKHKKNRQYKRMFKDYDEYKQKQINSGRRKRYDKETGKAYAPKSRKDENRLLLMYYADKKSTDKIIKTFTQAGFTKEEVLKAMGEGMNKSVHDFNEKHNNMKVIEHYTHVNEGYAHAHGNLYAYGTDRYGKPYYDINQSLFETYGGTKHKYKDGKPELDKNGKPKEFKKNVRDVWSDFRDDTDKMIHKNVNDKLVELAKSKGKRFDPPEFLRKESTETGVSHQKHKQQKELNENKDNMVHYMTEQLKAFNNEQALYDKNGNHISNYDFKSITTKFTSTHTQVKQVLDKRKNKLSNLKDEIKDLKSEKEELTNSISELREQQQTRQEELNQIEIENFDLTLDNRNLKDENTRLKDFQKDKNRDLLAYHMYINQERKFAREGRSNEFREIVLDMRDENNVLNGGKPRNKRKDDKGRTL